MPDNKRQFKMYKLLCQALRRDKIAHPGASSNFLLETFVLNNGTLTSKMVANRKLCEDGKFKIWRDHLSGLGWIQGWRPGDYSRHFPGPKLIKYVNKEKASLFEIASVQDVEESIIKLKAELQVEMASKEEVRNEIDKIWQAIRNTETNDPPVTETKVKKKIKSHLTIV